MNTNGMKNVAVAAVVGLSALCWRTASAALPTKFRWDDVDGKGTSYTTPVKTQTGSTDRSYAYSMMDYLETMRLIHAGTSYNSLTGQEKVDALGLVEPYADNAENRRGAIGAGDGFEVPVMEKSLDWMLRYGYNGHRVVDISFLLESHSSPIGKSINKNEITTLKKWIVEQGPFVVGYKHFDDYVAGAKYCYLPPRNSRLKYEEYNHHRTALIIGYDDSVPASAFSASAIHPDGPGAWIVKGNQGVAYGDNGYYYVSYYDESLLCYNGRLNEFCNYGTGANSGLLRLDELAAKVIDVDWDYKYGNVYCHDASTPCSFWWGTINSGGSSGFVNMFTAQSDDVVNAVGFWLDVPYGGTNILVTAYVGCDEGKPFSGRCMFFQKPLWFPSSGYHAIPLPEPLQFDVKAGQRFSVALEYGSNAAYNSVEPYRPAYAMALQLVDNPARGCSFYWDYSPNRLLDLAEESSNGSDPVLLDPLAGLSTLYHPVSPNMCFITAYTAAEGQIVLTATKGTVDDGIEVSWTPTKDGTYDLYRSVKGGVFSCIARGLATHTHKDKVNKDVEIDKWYDYKVIDTTNDIESNIDSGIVATKPVLEEVRVAKLWLEQEPPYKVQLKWNRYRADVFQVKDGDFTLDGIENTDRHYRSHVVEIGESGKEKVVDLAGGGLSIDYGCHGVYNMTVDWKYQNIHSSDIKAGNSVDNVEAKVYFNKYDRPVGGISNWYIFWPHDKALDETAASLMKPEIWVKDAPAQFDGSFYFNPNHIDPDTKRITSLGKTVERLKPIRQVDPRHIDCLEKDESDFGFYLSRIQAKLGIYDSDRFYVWEVEPQLKYCLSDIAAAYGATIEPSQNGYAGDPIGSDTKGLQCVADVMVHEMMHGWLFKNLYLGKLCVGRIVKHGWLETPVQQIDWQDWAMKLEPDNTDRFLADINGNWAVDSDGDGISDIYESNFPELNYIDNRDTLNVKSYNSTYSSYGDNEYLARREEVEHQMNKIKVNAENDWAFPGSKIATDYEDYRPWTWGRVKDAVKEPLQNDFSPEVRSRGFARFANAILANDDGNSHASGSLKAFYRPTICEFVFDVLEIVSVGEGVAQKTEDGGPYTSLSFPVSVTNMTDSAETCILRGYLLDGQSNAVAWASTVLDVPAGTVAAGSLVFDSEHLYSGENKDISLAWVAVEPLGDEFGALFDITNAMAHTDRVYKLDKFAPPPARIDARHITEEMGERELAIIVPVENFTADDLRVVATLAGTNGEYVASASTNVANGASFARLGFTKEQLAYSGIFGPYVVSSVQVLNDNESICGEMNAYVTNEYGESEIVPEDRVLEIDKNSFARVRPERSGEIAFAFSVNNRASDSVGYGVKAFVCSSDGTFVGVWRTEVELASGTNTVRLSFEIGEAWSKELEPYWIREVVLEPKGAVGERTRLIPERVEFNRKDAAPSVFFDTEVIKVSEGEEIHIVVLGGSSYAPSSVDVNLIHNTTAASDLDLTKAMVDGVTVKNLKFPYTVKWAKGEVAEKRISIPVKADTTIEGWEMLTLQLGNAKGMELGDARVCTVKIRDMNSDITIAQGLRNESLRPSMSGAGKWTAHEAAHYDPDDRYKVFVQSPNLKAGQTTKLDIGTFYGSGQLQFSLKFVGDDSGSAASTFYLYHNTSRYGVVDQIGNGDGWHGWKATFSSSGAHHFVLEFVQGSNPDVHVRLSSVLWVPDDEEVYQLFIMDFSNDMTSLVADAGYSSGAGVYKYGTKVTLTGNPRPGYEFAYWNSPDNKNIYQPKITTVVTNSAIWFTMYKKIPYVRALADPADGGKVSGSGLCENGKKVTLKATANKNFTFVGWTTNAARSVIAPYQDGDFVATTATLVADRSTKPTANSKTSTTITNLTGDVTYYAVFKSDPKVTVFVEATGAGAEPTGKGTGKYVAGTITGEGKYPPGKTKIALKAAANKNYVFSGWYEASGKLLTKDATCTIAAMPSNDVEYVAKFITTDDDKMSIDAVVDGWTLEPWVSKAETHAFATNIWAGVYLEWPVAASALSEAKVKVAGLPAGLKFTDKPVTTKIGTGKAAVTVTNVPANTIYGAPTAASKIDAKTKSAKPSEVKLTVTTAGKSSQTYQIDTVVDALPTWAQGTFAGGWEPEDAATSGGQVSLTVDAKGKVSGKVLGEGLTYTLAAPYYSAFALDENQASNFLADVTASWSYKEGSKTIKTNEVVQLVVQDNIIGGYAAVEDWFEAYTVNWKVEPWKTLGKSFDKKTMTYAILADGTFSEDEEVLTSALGEEVVGRVTLKFAASGAVTIAGEFAMYDENKAKYTTVKATGSATLVPVDDERGAVFIYLTPKGLAPHARCVEVPWPQE